MTRPVRSRVSAKASGIMRVGDEDEEGAAGERLDDGDAFGRRSPRRMVAGEARRAPVMSATATQTADDVARAAADRPHARRRGQALGDVGEEHGDDRGDAERPSPA